MRVLLLAMPDISLLSRFAVLPSLATSSLAGNINGDHEVDIADLVLIRRNFKKFLETRLSQHSPDIVGLSAMSFQVKTARYIARFLKQLDPEIKVVLGGYHATVLADEIGKSWGSELDFIIRGEGESTFNELVNVLDQDRKALRSVQGLSFRKNGKFIHNPRRELEELIRFKKPDRSARLLQEGFHIAGKKADVVESSRGCLNRCKFCSINKMYGQSFRTYAISRILDDIESCKRNGVKFIGFSDDNVTLNPNHLKNLCDGIIERSLDDIHYVIQASVKGLHESQWLLKRLIDANFKALFLGIENPDPRNLKIYGKYVKSMHTKAESIVTKLRSHGVVVIGGFILGNPDDTTEDFFKVLGYARKIKVDLAAFSALQPHPKTRMREILREKNLITNFDDYSKYDNTSVNIRTNHLTTEQLNIQFRKLWVDFYNLDWVKWTNVRRNYRGYFFKMAVKILLRQFKTSIPSYLRHKTSPKQNTLFSKL